MEKIPYKPGDVLVNKYNDEVEVKDNLYCGEIIMVKVKDEEYPVLKSLDMNEINYYGYTLKTPKEETRQECEFCKKMNCFGCYHNVNYGVVECHFMKETPTPWRPQLNDDYYSYRSDSGIKRTRFTNDFEDKFQIKSGNCFRTREEAEEKLKEIMSRPL